MEVQPINQQNYQRPLVPQVTEEQKQPKEVEKPRKTEGNFVLIDNYCGGDNRARPWSPSHLVNPSDDTTYIPFEFEVRHRQTYYHDWGNQPESLIGENFSFPS